MQRTQTKGHCYKRVQDRQVIFREHTAKPVCIHPSGPVLVPRQGEQQGAGAGQEPAPVVMSRKFPFCSANKSFLIPLLARRVMKQLQLQILRAKLIPSLVSSYPLIDLPRAYTLQQGDDGSVLKSSRISHRPGAHAAAQLVPPQLCILGAAGEAPGPRRDLHVPP